MKVSYLLLISLVTSISAISQHNDGWQNLFNKDLQSWIQLNGKARYEVVNGEIVATIVFKEPNTFLKRKMIMGI